MTVTDGEMKVPMPAWLLPFLEPARYKGAHGGRGSGKSHGFATLLVLEHVRNPDQSTVCVREVQRTLSRSVKKLLEEKIEELGVGHLFEVQQTVIKSRNGKGIIIFQGMQDHTADSIKSLEGFDRAWVEEAQSLSKKSLDLLRPTIRKDGSELWFTWNPRNATDAIDDLLRGPMPPKDAIVTEVNHSDNPWFNDVMRAELEHDRTRDLNGYLHVWEGAYVSRSEACVFKRLRVEAFTPPPGVLYRLGADWGFSKDPTALVKLYVEGRAIYIVEEAWAQGVETINLPDLFRTVSESELWPMTGDSSRPETISHMKRHGFPNLQPSVKGKNSVEDGIEYLRGFDIVVHPDCVHAIQELTAYAYKVDKVSGLVLPTLAEGNDHVADAVRYAVEGLRRATVKAVPIVIPVPVASRW